MRRVTRYQSRSFVVGIGVLVAAALIGQVSFSAHEGRLPFVPKHTVKAAFDHVGQLNVGDEVRENSIRVGQVTKVEIVDDKSVVTMDLTEDRPMYGDARAELWDQSALGQKFVELRRGTKATGPLGDGVIPVSRTERAHDLSEVLDVFDPPTRQALSSSLRELGGGAAGRGKDLNNFVRTAPGMLGDLQDVSGALSSEKADLPELLQSADRLSGRFEGREQEIASLLRRTNSTLEAVNVDDGRPLSNTVAKLPTTLSAAGKAMDTMDKPLVDTRAAVRTLRPGAQALGTATPDVRGVLREGVRPLRRVPAVAGSAEPAVGSLTGTFDAARPVAPKIADAVNDVRPPLKELGAHACDVGNFAFGLSKLFTSHSGWKHKLRIGVAAPSGGATSGVLPESNNPYPEPCTATKDRAPLGGLVPRPGGGPR